MAKATRPCGLPSSPRSLRICRPKAVEESARPKPMMTVVRRSMPNTQTTAMISPAVTITCAVPSPNTCRRMAHSRAGLSSTPITNSRKTTPNSAMWRMSSTSPISPSPQGPMSAPAAR